MWDGAHFKVGYLVGEIKKYTYLRYMTGTIPAFHWAICMKAGLAMSKWVRGGLHHPPLFEFLDQLGGQRLVAVTVAMPFEHHGDRVHFIW